MVGVAVNVTLAPEHIVLPLALDAMLTLAGKFGFTVVVILFDVAGDPVKHGVAFDVITTLTTSLFASVVVVNVALFVPAFTPFSFH